MNSFGRIFRVSILGESHGACVGALIDGCPAGLKVDEEAIKAQMTRRQGGNASGTTPRKEADQVLIKSGLFEGRTTGAPILLLIENQNTRSGDYAEFKDKPRPGHADWTGRAKFGGFNDYRGGGHFSGRLTAALVAAGAIARQLMPAMSIEASLLRAGGSEQIETAVQSAMVQGDSVGGVVECIVKGMESGLGEPFFDSLESLLAHAVFAIPAIKGVEFGAGFASAAMLGSQLNDEIVAADGKTASNNAGGINGGISNGNPLVFRVAVKPTSSIKQAQNTVDLSSGSAAQIAVQGRHDACIALRVPVVLEAVTAIVLADLMLLEQRIDRVLK